MQYGLATILYTFPLVVMCKLTVFHASAITVYSGDAAVLLLRILQWPVVFGQMPLPLFLFFKGRSVVLTIVVIALQCSCSHSEQISPINECDSLSTGNKPGQWMADDVL